MTRPEELPARPAQASVPNRTGPTRREFLARSSALAAALGAGAVWPASVAWAQPGDRDDAAARGTHFSWMSVGEGCWVGSGEGGNSLLVSDGGEAVLIDCSFAVFGRQLRREAEALGTQLKAVINTHHHGDHTGGNIAFRGDLPIYAHENGFRRVREQHDRYLGQVRGGLTQVSRVDGAARDGLLADAKALADRVGDLRADLWVPTQRVIDARSVLRVGELEIVLHHVGSGHTDNDLVIEIPQRRLWHFGDLLFHGLHPFINPPDGATIEGWINVLETLRPMVEDGASVVPGHGGTGEAEIIGTQLGYLRGLRDGVQRAVAAGATKREIMALELDVFEGLSFEQLKPRALEAAWLEYGPTGDE